MMSERDAFLERVFDSGHGGVCAAADFYSHCAPYPCCGSVSTRQEYIGAMDAAGLRRAIEEPARLAGWELEPGLADLILRDVGRIGRPVPRAGWFTTAGTCLARNLAAPQRAAC